MHFCGTNKKFKQKIWNFSKLIIQFVLIDIAEVNVTYDGAVFDGSAIKLNAEVFRIIIVTVSKPAYIIWINNQVKDGVTDIKDGCMVERTVTAELIKNIGSFNYTIMSEC